MSVLIFSFIVFIATFTENIFTLFFFSLFFLIVLFFFRKKINFKKVLITTLLSIVIVSISIFIRLINYNQNIPDNIPKTYVWTWQITDLYSQGRFVFQDWLSREYFLYSEQDYKIWDLIFLEAWLSTPYTEKQNYSISSQRLNFVNLSFLPQTFSYEFDFSKWLIMKWMYGSLYEQNSVIVWSFKTNIIQKTRWWLQSLVLSIYWDNKQSGLILWMLIWDKSKIPKDEYDTFIDSGLVHIIAVSWWNIIMIVVFLNFVLFFLPLYIRNIVILCVIIFYSLVCWLDSSVFRAMIMWWLSILALLSWRDVNIRRIMWLAFVSMLIFNPFFLLYDVWFLLSFSAIIWLIYFHKFINKKINPELQDNQIKTKKLTKKKKKIDFQKFLIDYISPTIWATLWVLPVMIFFMWSTNFLWIFANFIVLPFVPFVMIYGFISLFLYQIFPRERLLWIEKILINYIYFVSNIVAKYWVYLEVNFWRFKYILLISFLIRFIRKRLLLKE